ncbi:hypothetical protein X771_11560 [Mesorhizobium sp. LSJC277A00]|nr:hypothetical protein X771_11560 [Mesorhizobium sp. LSJC277A00]
MADGENAISGSGAEHADGHQAGASQPVKIRIPAQMARLDRVRFASSILPKGASDAKFGCAASRSLPARRFDGPFSGSAERACGQGRAEPFTPSDHAALIGATSEGKKELLGFQTGIREIAQSWRELLADVK